MKVYSWDEVACEVDIFEIDLPEDAPAHLVEAEVDKKFGSQPSEYSRSLTTDIVDLTLITGRFGRDRQYMLWWGPQAEKFAAIVNPFPEVK